MTLQLSARSPEDEWLAAFAAEIAGVPGPNISTRFAYLTAVAEWIWQGDKEPHEAARRWLCREAIA